jgi:hypothetical protein
VWVLCVLIIGTAVGGLFAASGGLGTNTKATEQKVTGVNARAAQLEAKQMPPNKTWVEEKDKEIVAERERIRRIWDKIYDAQQKNLQWPEAVGGLAFATTIEEQASKPRLDKPQEEQFEKYAAEAFGDLLAIVKAPNLSKPVAVKQDPRAADVPRKTPTLPPVPADYVVGWAPASQRRIADPLIRWGNEDAISGFGAPTTARAKKTQRDLWIYQSMLKAIAATNGDATANYLAKVKYILELQIGGDVDPLFRTAPAAPAAPASAPAAGGAKNPVAVPPPAPAPTTSTFVGIESIPVRMDLIVDQRYLSRLFAECANAPLPIQITGFSARYRSLSRRDHFDKTIEQPDENRPGGIVAAKEIGPVGTLVDTYDMDVSIEGKVNFYKPPDESLLGG